jgi:glycosyltransferase involved in cell wall biosynthesis
VITTNAIDAPQHNEARAHEGSNVHETLDRVHMKPIRIAHLHSSNGIYGAERWTATQIGYLNPDRVKSVVITIGTKGGSTLFHKMLLSQGHDAEHIAIPGRLNPKAVVHLRRILIRRGIEILHTHGFKSDIIGYLATRGLGTWLVATPHGWSADEGLRIRLYESVSRIFLRRFDRIYPVSPRLLEDLRERGFRDARLRLVLNAVDTAAFDECFQLRQARRIGEPFHVLFVGRLCRPKGVFELVDAFARARFDCPAQLHFVGEGPEQFALEARCRKLGIQSKVRFVGEVSSVAPHLKWGSVLVLPSYSEGIPRAVMEAFSAGVPVIGTSIPGIKQLITDRITGALVSVGNVDSLVRALERLASYPEAAHEMAGNAREYILAKHSARRQAAEFEHEYRELLIDDIRGRVAGSPP